jgi:hypothetical protein
MEPSMVVSLSSSRAFRSFLTRGSSLFESLNEVISVADPGDWTDTFPGCNLWRLASNFSGLSK